MASSSSPVDPAIVRIREDYDISADCQLEKLGSKYKGWEEDFSILPDDVLVVSEPHLQLLCFPLHPFYHYIYSVYNLHLLQTPPNSLRLVTGFLCLSILKDLQLTVEDFLFCFNRIRAGSSKYPRYFFSPKKNLVLFTGLPNRDPEVKTLYVLTGKWYALALGPKAFAMRRNFNTGKLLIRNLLTSIPSNCSEYFPVC